MKKLIESDKYSILHEYEKTFLYIKNTEKTIMIGEFYGDPYAALISKNEDFCVVAGEGLIIYYLNEPFYEYKSNDKTRQQQWKEWGRESGNNTVWIEKIEQIEVKKIRITTETNEKIEIDV